MKTSLVVLYALLSVRAFADAAIHRTKDGTVITVDLPLKITQVSKDETRLNVLAEGEFEGTKVGLRFDVPLKWEPDVAAPKRIKAFRMFPRLVPVGPSSEALDASLRRLFGLKDDESIFKRVGYSGATVGRVERLEFEETTIFLFDAGGEGAFRWRIPAVLDVPKKTLTLSFGEFRIMGGTNRANKAPEPTPGSVTLRASSR